MASSVGRDSGGKMDQNVFELAADVQDLRRVVQKLAGAIMWDRGAVHIPERIEEQTVDIAAAPRHDGRHERVQQRTGLAFPTADAIEGVLAWLSGQPEQQVDDMPLPQVVKDILELETDDAPVPQVVQGTVEVVEITPEERISERILKQIVYVPVPQISEEITVPVHQNSGGNH